MKHNQKITCVPQHIVLNLIIVYIWYLRKNVIQVIVLSGPIGAGKSSLTSILAEHLGTQAFYEGVDNNPVLPLYYKDMKRYTFLLNTYLLNHRLAQINQAIQEKNSVSDRSIYEDALFFKMNADSKVADPTEFKIYDDLLDNMMEDTPGNPSKKPDLLIYIHSIPYEYYEKYRARKYGAHGTSVHYVTLKTAKMLHKDPSELKMIICHLGSGSSITVVKNGKSFDTSMGFSPLSGITMGTRSGDIDPAIIPFLMEKEGMSAKEIDTMLNKKSGVLALSEMGSDFREIEDGVVAGDEASRFTMDAFQHRLVSYIGAYAAIMNGVDAIAFAGGLGENNAIMREEVANMLTWLGVEIDVEKNKCRGVERDLSTENAKVRMLLVPTNEELVIARDAKRLLHK